MPNAYKLMCFDRNINGSRDVKFLECDYLHVQRCVKLTLVIEMFFTLHRYFTVTVQYCCSVSKAKHDQVFSAALLNGRKIQTSLQLPDRDLTWRIASTYDPLDFTLKMN